MDNRTAPQKKPPAGSAASALLPVGIKMAGDMFAAQGAGAATSAASGGSAAGASSLAAAAPYALPVIGAALTAKGVHDSLENKPTKGPLAIANRGLTAFSTMGGSEVARALFGKSRTEVEDNRRGELEKQGIKTAVFDKGGEEKYNAVKDSRYADDYQGYDDKGNWVNNKFVTSRDENSLTGRDIRKYAVLSQLFPEYQNLDESKQIALADAALANATSKREHHGTFDLALDAAKQEELRKQYFDAAPSSGRTTTTQSRTSPRRQERKRAAPRSVLEDVPLDDILPGFKAPSAMPEPDDVKSAQEQEDVNKYKNMMLRSMGL